MFRWKVAGGVAALAIAGLVACSGDDDNTTATTAASTTTEAPASTAAPTSTEAPSTIAAPTTTEATTTTAAPTTTKREFTPQEKYFLITAASNGAQTQIGGQYLDNNGNIKSGQARQYCAALAPVDEKFANEIKHTTWPKDAQNEADALATAVAGDAGALYQCARASSNNEALASIGAHDFQKGGDASSAMRLALGLPQDR